MTVKVLIADEHPIVSAGIRCCSAESAIHVVGTIDQAEDLDATIAKLAPDVLVTEVRLNGVDIIRALETFSAETSGCRVVFFSSSSNATHIARASTIDCFDYLLKSSPLESLWRAIVDASQGAPTPANSLLRTTRKRGRATSRWSSEEMPLTQRELQVLQHVALGLSNREIGRALGISVETVKEHVQNTLRKLDASDRTQAAVWAVREGWI
jgi:DNA-binding NarL/FixJ family response regulator